MFTWLSNLLAKPLLPILEQSYVVVSAIKPAIDDIIEKGVELGIAEGSSIHTTLTTIKDAVDAVNGAIVKTIEFLGGTIPEAASVGSASLKDEIDKLKKLV